MHCVKSVRVRYFSGSHFLAFGLNAEKYSVSIYIQSKCGKIRTMRENQAVMGFKKYLNVSKLHIRAVINHMFIMAHALLKPSYASHTLPHLNDHCIF